jgi:mitosis inhibitor protein kinase SWE1
MSYANGSGGTLTLPSPTHVHRVDVTSAVRSLRRSLSRSPSKFRLVSQKSPSSSPKSPIFPSLSPKRATALAASAFTTTPTHTPSPLAKPFPPSVKLSLRSASRSKTASPRAASRSRTSPRSPIKRVLSVASDSGNSTPASSQEFGVGQENRINGSISPSELVSFEKLKNMPFNIEITAPLNHALSKLADGATDCIGATATTSSPLKRSDAIMNLDQASLGSPVAKRRSLHGSASFGHDFNIFDHGPTSSPHFEIHDDSNQEYELSASSINAGASLGQALTAMPRRSSSLRKSTLQQRHGDKNSWGRRHAAHELASSTDPATPAIVRSRPRLSLDQFMPPTSRDSLFNSQGSLPNASMHVLNQSHQPTHQPHPLSRTITTSSSNSSLVDDSPTHVPAYFGEQLRPRLDFSKSLPAGTLRPQPVDDIVAGEGSLSTPENYKSVKPLPAAFMSTGLISKVNRNPEKPQLPRGVAKGHMPDTPCKKPANGFATMPALVPRSVVAKARHIRHSFGTPSTPFNPHGSQSTTATFGGGAGVFGSSFGNRGLTRRGSFLSADDDESSSSPDAKGDGQSGVDYDFPPTPTKQGLVPSVVNQSAQRGNGSPFGPRAVPASIPAGSSGVSQKVPRTSSKLNLLISPDDQGAEESDASMDPNDSPTTQFRLSSTSLSMPSFGRSRALRGSNVYSPAPLTAKSLTTSLLSPSRKPGFAKISHVAPASPLERIDFIEKLSPRTPQDTVLPPDPSGLSISNHKNGRLQKRSPAHATSMPPPATPTSGRDHFMQFGDRQLSITPINGFGHVEIDETLTSRFDKVELIGRGEFSQVYRVTQPVQTLQSFLFGTSVSPPRGRSPPAPPPDRVFAVKKSRQPYQGTRDRQRKLQEVRVLKALGHSDHVVHLIDSWETNEYLYIQTEFCEEGSLDLFLSQVGRRGRLDDFRIWKIMLELSQVSRSFVFYCNINHYCRA